MRLHPARLHVPRHLATRLTLVNALQLLLVAGSLSWLSYSLGRQSGLAESEQFRQVAMIEELSDRLSQRLQAPRLLNALNLLEIRSGRHRLDDHDHFARVFWRQMQIFPVAYINIGTPDGAFIGVERTDAGRLLLNEDSPRLGRGRMAVHSLGPDGVRGELLELIPGMTNLHEEPWYADTVRAGRPTWSAIYAWEDKPEVISIAYNSPIRGADGRLQGVIGVDMVLTQLSTWLAGLWRERDGLALIVEPDGRLVASSRPADVLSRTAAGVQRNQLSRLAHPLARALRSAKFEPGETGGALRLKPGVLQRVQGRPVTVDGQAYIIDASPWGRQEGLNWVLLTAMRADAQTRSSQSGAWIALMASALALLAAVVLAQRLIGWLLRPLLQLQREAARLGESLGGDGALSLRFDSGIGPEDSGEMRDLDGAIRQLVERFNRLTAELQAAMERERDRDARALTLLRDKLHSSLQAAAVAHEINQPLSVLLLNSQLLLEQVRSNPSLELPAGWRHQLQNISQEAERVVVTIEKMRTLLRNVQTVPRRVDLREVARSALLYARSGGIGGLMDLDTAGLQPTAAPAWIEGDGEQIQIAILNLLRNAAEALRETPGREPRVRLTLERQGQDWLLAVEDNGPGFPDGLLPGDPLDTTKRDGSGLGLFVVHTTMANHRGRLELEPRPGGGARAMLRFRALEPPVDAQDRQGPTQ
ncbi:MAG: hypothetical protein RLZZ219_1337 [Cyanobacteriota bacterium]|jgi:signal transduction histidine kinase